MRAASSRVVLAKPKASEASPEAGEAGIGAEANEEPHGPFGGTNREQLEAGDSKARRGVEPARRERRRRGGAARGQEGPARRLSVSCRHVVCA